MRRKKINNNKNKIKIKFFKNAKLTNIVVKFLEIILVIIFTYNIIYTLENAIIKNKYITIFKWSLVVVKNDNISNTAKKYDLAILRRSQYDILNENLIIGYEKNEEILFTKIKKKYNDSATGKLTYVCQYDGTYRPSNESIAGCDSYWVYIGKIKYIGFFVNIIQSKVFSVLVIISLIILRKYNRYEYKQRKIRKKKRVTMN